MVSEVEISDNTNTVLDYVSKLKSFKNGKVYKFKPGINIIIGKNGCGKSSLLKIISEFMLCNDSIVSKAPLNGINILKISDLFNDNKVDDTFVKNGIKVKSDYMGVAYRYITHDEASNELVMDSVLNMSTYIDNASSSTGEKMLNSLNSLFEYAFNNTEVEFPIRKLTDTRNKSTDIWKDKVNNLLSYYKENRVNITQGEFQYTFLVDEPDRNLDIDNIEMMYNILSFKKEYTQLICVIHNPILIYKLSKLDYINFVEMTPRYLSKIKKLFKNL